MGCRCCIAVRYEHDININGKRQCNIHRGPTGGTKNLRTTTGGGQQRGPVAHDLYAKLGGLQGPVNALTSRGVDNDWATSGELRLGIVKESQSKVVL